MSTFGVRLLILLLIVGGAWLMSWFGRRVVAQRRQRALAALPPDAEASMPHEPGTDVAHVRILAFSSDDCHQCHRLQTPALSQVQHMRGDAISITEIDAPSAPELAQRYQVLTVPTTVLLDGTGKAHAVNYGFANTKRLLEQIDSILAQSSQQV